MTNYTNSSNSSCWFEYQTGKSKFGNTLTGKILQAGVQVNHWFKINLFLYINILYLNVLIFPFFYKKFIRGYVWVYIWKWFELGYQLFKFFRCALIIIITNVASKIKLTKRINVTVKPASKCSKIFRKYMMKVWRIKCSF